MEAIKKEHSHEVNQLNKKHEHELGLVKQDLHKSKQENERYQLQTSKMFEEIRYIQKSLQQK